MKTFKTFIAEYSNFRFVYENLNISSSLGRKTLLNAEIFTDKTTLQREFDVLEQFLMLYKNILSKHSDILHHILSQISDISVSIKNVKSGETVDDIQLFEIKKFSILSQKLSDLLKDTSCEVIKFHDLKNVIKILDPDNTGLISFYIYDSYDSNLAQLRKKRLNAKTEEESESLFVQCLNLEDKIRQKICNSLQNFTELLLENLSLIGVFDILLAKAELIQKWNLTKPEIVENKIHYKGLFNPYIKSILELKSKTFQPIDIEIFMQPCLITGANMSGKTVLLKTLALSQIMFQFGFYVPAKYAEIMLVDDILVSIGDKQDELNGLSSFGAEMINIDKIIKKAKKHKKIFALVDELARTTNPDEGRAIVNAFVNLMEKNCICCVITTHYSGIITNSKRLRIKGLQEIKDNCEIKPENLNDFMDYTLFEVHDDNVPNEALKIIEILRIDKELSDLAKEFLKK